MNLSTGCSYLDGICATGDSVNERMCVMKNLKQVISKRIGRRVTAAVLCVALTIPLVVQAVTITPEMYDAQFTRLGWQSDIENAAELKKLHPTGLAYNNGPMPYYNNTSGLNWPFSATQYVIAREGKIKPDYEQFANRYLYCTANHVQAYRLLPGMQAYHSGTFSTKDDNMYDAAVKGKLYPKFNFLMLAIACGYPLEYNASDETNPYNQANYIAMQTIAWACTDEGSKGFSGTLKEDKDAAVIKQKFLQDLEYFRNTASYQAIDVSFSATANPAVYQILHSAPSPNSGAGKYAADNQIEMNYLDACFYDVWTATHYTNKLTPDWQNEITSASATAEKGEDGQYHVYLDLFVSDEADIYLEGITPYLYGDWKYLGKDEATGKQHFVSASGELDEYGSIGYLEWDKKAIAALMPIDETKAKLYTFIFYNNTHKDVGETNMGFGNSQTFFSSVIDNDLKLYVRIENNTPPDQDGPQVKRHKHSEYYTSTYNVNLLKYDAETGKPLAGSHWDILEAFDESQLDDTDLDRTPDNPGEYTSELGTLNDTEWGDDEIASNYTGNLGVNNSDTNKYNWGNDSGSQFETWDDPEKDPCMKDDNVTGADGKLYEIDSMGNQSTTVAHTDYKYYTYNKGYCDGHPAPTPEYVECDHDEDEDCNCDEINQEIHDQAWGQWLKEVETCEKLVEEGGFFHAINPGEAKAAMEADRDQFYKDFISLRYDYSAEEIEAAPGYILHGKHTDDIPIEWRTVTSSEYKDTDEATVLQHSSGTSSGEDASDDEEYSVSDMENGKEVPTATESDAVYTFISASSKPILSDTDRETEAVKQETGDNPDPAMEEAETEPEDYEEDSETDPPEIADLEIYTNGETKESHRGIRATGSDATKSDAVAEHSIGRTGFMGTIKEFAQDAANAVVSLFKDSTEGDAEGGDLRDSITLLPSEANTVTPAKDDIVDWTFVVYDHRTEGEIHFNKRDFDLLKHEGDDYDTYAQENGDGALEGAVYGLFAAQDIIHPDTDGDGAGEYDTGVVYQKDDLVAVATTDRNGDGSFMAITEAPGYTYDYDTGRVVKRDGGWADEAPKNLHTGQSEGDAKEEDAERFVGHTPANEEIEITDSNAGDDTYYQKLSSNQGIEDTWCEKDTTGYMPIRNNEANNGNCWIGQPLILGKSGSSYYIKELARSEGYELSVYGKDGELITNKEAFEAGGEEFTSGTASATGIEKDRTNGGNTFAVTSSGTENGYILKVANIPEGATFYITSSEYVWDDTVSHKEERQEEVPVYAEEGSLVQVGGKSWEASVGDTVEYNGKTFTVNNVQTIPRGTRKVTPDNRSVVESPHLDPSVITASGNVMGDINKLFSKSGFRKVESGSPWIGIPIGEFSVEALADAINNTIFTDDEYSVYNAMEMIGTFREGGNTYAAIAYCYRDINANDALYNEQNQKIYVKIPVTYKTASGAEKSGFAYRSYDGSEYDDAVKNSSGFITSAIVPNEYAEGNPVYGGETLENKLTFKVYPDLSLWAYADGEQLLDQNGDPATKTEITYVDVTPTLVEKVTNEKIDGVAYEETNPGAGTYTIHITQEMIEATENGTINFRILYDKDKVTIDGTETEPAFYASIRGITGITFPYGTADSYIETILLMYPGQDTIISDGGTTAAPTRLYERPIRQKIKVAKDIQTLPEPKVVWYCLNCGYENPDGETACGFCDTARTTEETKTIRYAHDTYSAVHKENISAGRNAGIFDTVTDWLTSLLGGGEENDSAADIPNFRFKAYLKSNLERLYRDADGNIVWMDRNGNTMTPQYEDTNKDGNYDTFTWKYDEAYDGKEVDFPEKDAVSEGDGEVLESANVQKIYTKVPHNEDSNVSSAQANNVWSDYNTPQSGTTENVGEKDGYSTSLREKTGGEPGDLSGMAVRVNDSLYSYDGKNTDTEQSDRINDGQNSGCTRLLETTKATMEDGAGETRDVESYNYEKFFDAIAAANTDVWDDDMHSTFTGDSMANYPGQHWFETFYEKYQKDDADPDYTIENTDGADADDTAGGDKDTSFKPFRWIRENFFGDRGDYEKYPAEHNGENTEVTTSTSDFARANAEASDAVRQFATKWYLEDEAAKLVTANGTGQDIAKNDGGADGEIAYDEAVYDEALFNAIAKAYNYLKPFYIYDLDTIYSVEWDSEADGGADGDYTTLSIDNDGGEEYYNISSYLPYGAYVIVEQQPQRRDGSVNDWENRSYTIEKPKELILPAVYDAAESNDTTDNYDSHYNYSYDMDLQDQAKAENYLIRFGEEWPHNNSQDEREYVIRAHNYSGDFEVYKYGLDIDRLQGEITYDGGDYAYAGFGVTQEAFDPLKDYYETTHRGEEGVEEIGKENGGNDDSHLYAIDKTDNAATANGSAYDGDPLENRFFYGSISEDAGISDDVMYKGGGTDDNNASGMQWKDGVRAMTGELTAYEGKYAQMLVPWTVTAPADLGNYSGADFSGYADVNMRDGFYTTTLRINKTDSETGEYILHDNAIFGLYAGSRYQSFEEIEEDAKLIEDPEEREMFLEQFKPGDAKFYLKDTVITGTKEFLMGMGAKDITPAAKGRSGVNESGAGAGELYSGTVPKGTPICLESERIMLTDETGARTGQMTVYTTLGDVKAEAEDGSGKTEYINQNVGWFETPQPVGAGVYVLAELKAPAGYARSKPVAYEVYSDGTYYYPDGDMYSKVKAVRYDKNIVEDIEYDHTGEQ